MNSFPGNGHVPAEHLTAVSDPIANENFVLRNGSKSVLATYKPHEKSFVRIDRISASWVHPRNSEQSFALQALLDDNIKLVTLTGKAGSGKTLLALAAALERKSHYRQILLARPAVPLSNRDRFLPGDIQAKLDPYMQPLYDNIAVMQQPLAGNSALRSPKVQDLLAESP
ncbi:MAG: PhoH family protein [Planctomycetaceae bacterium]